MKRTRFTEEQTSFALQQAEHGTAVMEVCRKMGISEQTFYRKRTVCYCLGESAFAPQTAQAACERGPSSGAGAGHAP